MTVLATESTTAAPTPPIDAVVQMRGITRYFGRTCAVDSVSLTVPRGSVFALLGRNGSGKSTLVRMLLGMLSPTRGSATILGDDCQSIRPATRGRIGYVAEGHPLIDWMRVRDLAAFQRGFYPGRWDAKTFTTVIDHFALSPRARAGQLSRGQRAGLSLALVLATRPELLVMDDPALGLDPVARRALLEAMILVTRDAGHSILFTSHELADVERVADHIGIIDQSVLRVAAGVETFRDAVRKVIVTFADNPPATPPAIAGLLQARRDGSELTLVLAGAGPPARAAADKAIAALQAASVRMLPLSLEDAVVAYLSHRDGKPSLLQTEGTP